MKLLIVDDQHSVYLYLQKVLDLPALGFEEVRYAENGLHALDMIAESPPDIMLMDIQMQFMNGLELLAALRDRGIAQPETIVLSAYDEFTYAQKCIEFGVRGYVLKPIDPSEITGLLRETRDRLAAARREALLSAAIRDARANAQLSREGGTDAQAVGRIRAYVDAHIGADLSLNAMARQFFVSRYQISRLFKQLYGLNYQDYVLSVRMKTAAEMLAGTDARLYEIAIAVGFDEPSYFSNVFKRYFGMSPKEYRKSKAQQERCGRDEAP